MLCCFVIFLLHAQLMCASTGSLSFVVVAENSFARLQCVCRQFVGGSGSLGNEHIAGCRVAHIAKNERRAHWLLI